MTIRIRFAVFASLASIVAVAVSGVVVLVVVNSSLTRTVDGRLESIATTIAAPADVEEECARVRASASDADRVASRLVGGTERCRNASSAPSPRALGVASHGDGGLHRATRSVGGSTWRVVTRDTDRDGRVVVAERVDANETARRQVTAAIVLAVVLGAVVAALVGALVAGPATRRIDRLLARIGVAGSDRTGEARVGRVGGRDLDAAARSFDELLDDLRAAEAAQRRLFADAAHELRTPLTSVRTNAQLLSRDETLGDEARDMADRIARQVDAVATLVTGLVDHTAFGAWAMGEHEELALAPLAAEAAARAAERWPGTDVVVHADHSLAAVDAELVLRALANLIDNAVVHGGDGVQIRIEVVAGQLAVEDDGVGFGGLDLEETVRAFRRGPDSLGSGLGLAFAEHVARAHGGAMRVGAVAGGRGARVVLDLARADDRTLG